MGFWPSCVCKRLERDRIDEWWLVDEFLNCSWTDWFAHHLFGVQRQTLQNHREIMVVCSPGILLFIRNVHNPWPGNAHECFPFRQIIVEQYWNHLSFMLVMSVMSHLCKQKSIMVSLGSVNHSCELPQSAIIFVEHLASPANCHEFGYIGIISGHFWKIVIAKSPFLPIPCQIPILFHTSMGYESGTLFSKSIQIFVHDSSQLCRTKFSVFQFPPRKKWEICPAMAMPCPGGSPTRHLSLQYWMWTTRWRCTWRCHLQLVSGQADVAAIYPCWWLYKDVF